MLIIPAIDIKDGACVRLVHGDFMRKTVYSEDPVEMARSWASKGAQRLHIVDLDGALEGKPKHLEIAARIKKETRCVVEFGGGLRDRASVDSALAMGIDKLILGTAAIENSDWVAQSVKEHPDRFMSGIDSVRGVPATAGWKKGSEMTTDEALKKMERLGFTEVIFTDILRDGTLEGPNLPAVKDVISKTKMKVYASGGVSGIGDVKALHKIPGVAGVIIGKALYDGRLILEDCFKDLS